MLDSISIDPTVLTVLLGSVLPLLVRLVTTNFASSKLQAALLALLAAATGALSAAQTNAGVLSKDTLVFAAAAWVMAVASHYGFHKPTGVTDWVGDQTAGIGVGGNPDENPPAN